MAIFLWFVVTILCFQWSLALDITRITFSSLCNNLQCRLAGFNGVNNYHIMINYHLVCMSVEGSSNNLDFLKVLSFPIILSWPFGFTVGCSHRIKQRSTYGKSTNDYNGKKIFREPPVMVIVKVTSYSVLAAVYVASRQHSLPLWLNHRIFHKISNCLSQVYNDFW